jgi:hypothetical protein
MEPSQYNIQKFNPLGKCRRVFSLSGNSQVLAIAISDAQKDRWIDIAVAPLRHASSRIN